MLEIYKEWQENILEPHINDNDKEKFSAMFLVGVPKEYKNKGKKIMIIGQNGNSTTEYNSSDLESQLNWHGEYLERQVYDIENGQITNSSPFWQFFRKFEENGYDLIWNNIDKIIKIKDGENKIITLSEEDELALNAPYGLDNKTLLEREIEFLKPDALIFVTGPNYYYSMATSFGINPSVLKNISPTSKSELVDLTDVFNLQIPALWTYHPKPLQLQRLTNKVLKDIFNFLKE